ncbi:MAG: DUF2141 domain-containing protein [Alphaproteobacteria bacterium]|nr:DUF2141 domain-containing protein [Alphaproteobacteria bacterium]
MFKFISTLLVSAHMMGAAYAQEMPVELSLTVDGIAPSEGSLMIAVFDSADAWNGGAPVAGIRASVDGEQVTATLGTLPAGRYGIKMYHDVNANGEMDTNLMGIPSEPFAFSNNARGRFGPASWDDAAFELTAQSANQSIRFD